MNFVHSRPHETARRWRPPASASRAFPTTTSPRWVYSHVTLPPRSFRGCTAPRPRTTLARTTARRTRPGNPSPSATTPCGRSRGSSPHARCRPLGWQEPTPVESCSSSAHPQPRPDHPRTRGDHRDGSDTVGLTWGPPRTRGDHSHLVGIEVRVTGPPPHTRGPPARGRRPRRARGTTPAHAGTTLPDLHSYERVTAICFTAHPPQQTTESHSAAPPNPPTTPHTSAIPTYRRRTP